MPWWHSLKPAGWKHRISPGRTPGIKQASAFFFEKKNQKTFGSLMREDPISPHQTNEVFLLLFLQKKKTLPS
jgi:hypothetical protein